MTRIFRIVTAAFLLLTPALAQNNDELRFCLLAEPRTFDPQLVEEDASETVRYLTGGVLIRLNRQTQKLEPNLAKRWKVSPDGKTITFTLREGLRFSDGTRFSASDVAYTMDRLMDPKLNSPTGDTFRSAQGKVTTTVLAQDKVQVSFPSLVAGIEKHFDAVAIMSATSPNKERAVLGPYSIAEHKPGSHILLKRNPYYWKKDASGRQLPHISAIRLEVQQNRDIELMRFLKGEIHLINTLNADLFEKLYSERPESARDIGVSFDTEQFWFNQSPKAPISEHKRAWFTSTNFRRAISEAINRADMARVVYRGHAQPASGPTSPANQFWFNSKLKPHPYDVNSAMQRLQTDGFRMDSGTLRDRAGNPVEFSIVTNAGNKPRERMATMIQQDLKQIGIKVQVVPLDFPSLIERITRSFDYEAIILGLVNVDPDPMLQMNVWLSSAENHQWNPGQKTPATPWEAEIDKLMRAQASTADLKKRKRYFDRVQEIVSEQAPFLYLVNKNSFAAVSSSLRNVKPSILRPQTFWNVDELALVNDTVVAAK